MPKDGTRSRFDERALQRYPQLAKIEHVHHAGNSSGIVDGASAVLIASPDYAKAHGLKPRARIGAMATAATEPVIMLTAPAPATERVPQEGRHDDRATSTSWRSTRRSPRSR